MIELEVLPRRSPRAAALAWSPETGSGDERRRALFCDAGRLSCPSRLARHTRATSSEEIVVRWVPWREVARDRPPLVLVALQAVRWEALLGSLLPVALGLVHAPRLRALPAAAMILATLFIHAAVNLLSEAFEHVRGDDSLLRLGGSKVLQRGWLTARQLAIAGVALGAAGATVGVGLAIATASWPLLALGALGALVASQFRLPPLRLSGTAIGEAAILLVFGPLVAAATCFAASGSLRVEAAAAGLVASAALGLRRHLRSTRRLPDDTMLGHRTLATRLGFGGSRALVVALGVALVALPPICWAVAGAPRWVLGSLALAPLVAWALAPALAAFAPHDPALTRAMQRTSRVLPPFAAAIVILWALPG